MRIVFDVQSTNTSGAAPCGVAPSVLTRGQYGLTVIVDGTLIGTALQGSFIPNISGVATTNGLSVDFSYTNPFQYGTIRIDGLDIHESTSVELIVTKTHCHTFAKVFTVYGYDLGNFPSAPVNNPAFDIILIEDYTSPIASEAFTSVIQIPRPLTNQTYLYKSNSAPCTDYVFYDSDLNDVLHGDGFVIGNNSSVPEAYTMECFNPAGNCTSGFNFISPKWKPSIIVQATHNGCITEDCFSILTTSQAFAYLDFSNVATVYVQNIEHYGFLGFTIDFQTIDIAGTSSNPETFIFDGINPIYSHNAQAYPYNFVSPNVGDYVIEGCFTIREQDEYDGLGDPTGIEPIIVQCCNRLILEGCNWWSVRETTTCGEYEFCNKSTTDITITSYKLTNGVWVELGTITLDACTCSTQPVITNQGIYKLEALKGSTLESSIIFNDCSYRTCIAELIKKLICNGDKACNDCDSCNDKDYYNFNALMAAAHVYRGIVSNVYDYNLIYTVIDSSTLNDLIKADEFLSLLSDYCEDCVPKCSECN